VVLFYRLAPVFHLPRAVGDKNPVAELFRRLLPGVKELRGMQEKHGYYLEDLSVGMTSIFAKTVTEADIVAFAGV
jgi:hypothetical protein